MNLQIRDPRARALAEELAALRKSSMTEVVIEALEAELKRASSVTPLSERIGRIVSDLQALGRPDGKNMSRDEVDRMWGHD
ncbi:transcriptional regulator [Salmonella enterica subsp. enterica]|nr:transcriptional regulator [Salmonella enterica subsp. enterica]MIL09248.1 transcriptional regulator [Salmonella enterica subsp. enterica serovar Enteritidis]